MKLILLIHGANLNMLGKRDQSHYGTLTLKELEAHVANVGKTHGFKVKAFQSNFEGGIIDFLQKNASKASGIIINPGAYTHYSYAIHDALLDTGLPAIEVHLSNVTEREDWRAKSVIAPACVAVFAGEKEKSYEKAVNELAKLSSPSTKHETLNPKQNPNQKS
ncbi:MAG: 3-dehydroquinate dehydratase [Candidatus Taylorbacteria bacterium CG11_big_fil_rev_8_21_14_0_20_46_11]|uniref:3-dehydroquinate dehydratase n=1 Tax=Candidatus Taylorbacteria bacterium CG11_big_fil_rev_8_21_14_0_20_46_11 TaxID=1975025 RepID=A0A2H0KCX3_9BACT|nr:MAG: 3-dehydroquinate dehydratase [Candidatus Taylorbacteria bacterium CG11_big_fil_rev_8_21_14_0_20_46_11]